MLIDINFVDIDHVTGRKKNNKANYFMHMKINPKFFLVIFLLLE